MQHRKPERCFAGHDAVGPAVDGGGRHGRRNLEVMPRALVRRIAVEETIQRGRIGPSRSAVTGACQSDHTADVMFRRCNLLTLPTSGRGSAPTSTSGIVSQTPRESRNVAWKCQTPRGPGSPKRCVHRLWGRHQHSANAATLAANSKGMRSSSAIRSRPGARGGDVITETSWWDHGKTP